MTRVQRLGPFAQHHLPWSFNNLRNITNFTTIQLCGGLNPHVQFSGPNGRVKMISAMPQVDETRTLFESLDQFDTSKVEGLEINCGNVLSSYPPHRALSMKDLRTFTISQCPNPHMLILALDPDTRLSGDLACPKLEVVIKRVETFDLGKILETVATRASRGPKLKLIRIVGQGKSLGINLSEPMMEVMMEIRTIEDGGMVCARSQARRFAFASWGSCPFSTFSIRSKSLQRVS